MKVNNTSLYAQHLRRYTVGIVLFLISKHSLVHSQMTTIVPEN